MGHYSLKFQNLKRITPLCIETKKKICYVLKSEVKLSDLTFLISVWFAAQSVSEGRLPLVSCNGRLLLGTVQSSGTVK